MKYHSKYFLKICALLLVARVGIVAAEVGPADLPLERFETDKPAYTEKLFGKGTYRLSPVVVNANCSGRGLRVELDPTQNTARERGYLQMEWPLEKTGNNWSKYDTLLVWFHVPKGGMPPAEKMPYRLDVEVQTADGSWYMQPANALVKPDVNDAWQTLRFALKKGRWKSTSGDSGVVVPDFAVVKAMRLRLPLNAAYPLAYEIAGIGLYEKEPVAGSQLLDAHYFVHDNWLRDARIQQAPEAGPIPSGPADLVIDSFDPAHPRHQVIQLQGSQGQFTAAPSTPKPPCGGGVLQVNLPSGAGKDQQLVWKAPASDAWRGDYDGIILWCQISKDTPFDLGIQDSYLLSLAYRPSLAIKTTQGGGWVYANPILRREGNWQALRFPFVGIWRPGGGPVKGDITEITLNLPAPLDTSINFNIAGLGLYKPFSSPTVRAEVLQVPDYGPTITILSSKDTATKGAYYTFDDYDADKVTVDADGLPHLKDQTYRYRLVTDKLAAGQKGTLLVEARDYWGVLKDSQTFTVAGADARKGIERMLVLPGKEPGYLNMSAVLQVDGREIYRTRWVMASRLPNRDGRLAYLWDKARRGETVKLGFIGGSITVTGGSPYPSAYSNVAGGLLSQMINELGGKGQPIIAGVPGTGSNIGLWRMDEQLLDRGIDLLVCEFAVNDGSADQGSAERVGTGIIDTMEGIVRKTLTKNPKAAIVFLYVSDGGMLRCYQDGGIPHSIVMHHKVARHYGIPEVYMTPAFEQALRVGAAKADELLPDRCHPSHLGARCYGEILARAIASAMDWPVPATPPALPAPLGSAGLDREHFHKIEPVSNEGFNYVEKGPGWFFVDFWKTEQAGAKLVFPVKGRQIGLFSANGSFRYSGAGYPPTEVHNPKGSVYMLPALATPIAGDLTIEALPEANGKVQAKFHRWVSQD